jgi:hypothetical protein
MVEQLTQAHFEEALLPRLVKGPGGEVVECYHDWVCREEYEQRRAILDKLPAGQPAKNKQK